jgi:hypothetical protein
MQVSQSGWNNHPGTFPVRFIHDCVQLSRIAHFLNQPVKKSLYGMSFIHGEIIDLTEVKLLTRHTKKRNRKCKNEKGMVLVSPQLGIDFFEICDPLLEWRVCRKEFHEGIT